MKKSYIYIILFLCFIIFISILGSIIISGDTNIEYKKDILVIQENKEKYFSPYGYTIDNPNVIVNPYGNSPLTAIVMFETYDYSEVSILIKSKDGNSDINHTFSKEKYHMIPIYGLYSDYDNTVIIRSEGKENTINIKTDKLPDNFMYSEDRSYSNFKFYNVNYPYIVDANNEVRWYLNSNYYGNISMFADSLITIGSDRYDENDNTISFYKMNLLGKIYNEYLLPKSYYGFNSIYKENILVLSDDIISIDMQTGEIIKVITSNKNFSYLSVMDDIIVVGKEDKYYKVIDDSLEEFDYIEDNNIISFYNNTNEYSLVQPVRFGCLNVTSKSSKKISLLKYDKYDMDNIEIFRDVNRVTVLNNSDSKVYLILDKFLDKRIYEVDDVKYINTIGLSGNYTVYFEIDDKLYKTDYLLEV